MATHVYANKSEIVCKTSTGDADGAFPDVCFTTPPPVAGGTPIPVLNNCAPKDLKKISKSVLIKGGGIALENKSFFKKSSGAPAANFKKGIISGKKHSKGFHQAWSPNVKVEGKGVARHMDLVTHNHSNPTNGAFNLFDSNKAVDEACKETKQKVKDECKVEDESDDNIEGTKGWREKYCGPLNESMNLENFEKEFGAIAENVDSAKLEALFKGMPDGGADAIKEIKASLDTYHEDVKKGEKKLSTIKNKHMASSLKAYADANPCLKAKKCELVSYEQSKSKKEEDQGCCPGQTGHHLMPDAMFRNPDKIVRKKRFDDWLLNEYTGDSEDPKIPRDKMVKKKCWGNYSEGSSPTICVEGGAHTGSHGVMHKQTKKKMKPWVGIDAPQTVDYEIARNEVIQVAHDEYQCEKGCLEAQMDAYYDQAHTHEDDCECENKNKKEVIAHKGMTNGAVLTKKEAALRKAANIGGKK